MDVNTEADHRQQRVEKYFCRTPDPGQQTRAILLMSASALGGLLTIILFAQGSGLGVLFLIASGFGGYKGVKKKADYDRRYAAAEPKPRDEEMDGLLASDLDKVCARAIQRLGLTCDELELFPQQWDPVANLAHGNSFIDQQQKRPWSIFGPEIRGFSFGPKFRAFSTVGRDGVCRFAAYDVMVICPTGYHLALYECTIDFLTGRPRDEQTREYHYADVVSVSTSTRSDEQLSFQPLDLRGDETVGFDFGRALFRDFEIVVSSGDRSKIVVGIQDEDRPDRQVALQPSGIEEVISSVRRMLKEKKGGAVGPAGQIKGLPPGHV